MGFLLLAIMLGFIRKMNTGLLCIAFALLLGRMAGISDAEIIKGFNASLFLMLLGVTYLFSLAQINGRLDLLALNVIYLSSKRVYLNPIIGFILKFLLYLPVDLQLKHLKYRQPFYNMNNDACSYLISKHDYIKKRRPF